MVLSMFKPSKPEEFWKKIKIIKVGQRKPLSSLLNQDLSPLNTILEPGNGADAEAEILDFLQSYPEQLITVERA
jgi:hypothetical protein